MEAEAPFAFTSATELDNSSDVASGLSSCNCLRFEELENASNISSISVLTLFPISFAFVVRTARLLPFNKKVLTTFSLYASPTSGVTSGSVCGLVPRVCVSTTVIC